MRLKNQHTKRLCCICDYKNGILVLMKIGAPRSKSIQPVQVELSFIRVKYKTLLFTLKKDVNLSPKLSWKPSLIFCDGRFMAIDIGKKKLLFIVDLFGRRVEQVEPPGDMLISVARVEKKIGKEGVLKKKDDFEILFFRKILVIMKKKIENQIPFVFYQTDYSLEPDYNDDKDRAKRTEGNFVHLTEIEKGSGKLVIEDYFEGKILAKL